jgi:DNA-binding MarR family transcriptional regulator
MALAHYARCHGVVLATLAAMAKSFNFQQAPGHWIRRAHQLSVAAFFEETAAFDITPLQFCILNVLVEASGLDQISLAERVAFDPATSGSVICRLEQRGLVRREPDQDDRRRKLLWITQEGQRIALEMKTAVRRAHNRLVEPLSNDERSRLVDLLRKLVSAHERHR